MNVYIIFMKNYFSKITAYIFGQNILQYLQLLFEIVFLRKELSNFQKEAVLKLIGKEDRDKRFTIE